MDAFPTFRRIWSNRRSFRLTRKTNDPRFPTFRKVWGWAPSSPQVTRVRQESLLQILASATERSLPLPSVLSTLIDSTAPDSWKTKVQELIKHLKQGIELPNALARIPGLIPAEALLLIRLGTETNQLPQALREAATAMRVQREAQTPFPQFMMVYLLALLLVLATILTFIMYFIIPKFKKIFEDFGVKMPGMTLDLIRISDGIGTAFGGVLFPVVLVGLLVLMFYVMVPMNESAALVRWWKGRFYRYSAPGILRSLALAVEARYPLEDALSILAKMHPVDAVGAKLKFIQNESVLGISPWDSFVQMKLIRLQDRSVLNAAEKAGNLSWALRELAETLQRRNSYKLKLRLELFRPIILTLIGAVVGFVVIALFLPLIQLINHLT